MLHDGADQHYVAPCGCFAAVEPAYQSSPPNHSMRNVSMCNV